MQLRQSLVAGTESVMFADLRISVRLCDLNGGGNGVLPNFTDLL
jgi:hypothetical protein